jgi:hypothetical protein
MYNRGVLICVAGICTILHTGNIRVLFARSSDFLIELLGCNDKICFLLICLSTDCTFSFYAKTARLRDRFLDAKECLIKGGLQGLRGDTGHS